MWIGLLGQAAPDLPSWTSLLLGPLGVLVGLLIALRAYDSGRIVRREDHERQLKERDERITGLETEVKAERQRSDALAAADRQRMEEALDTMQQLLETNRHAVGTAEQALEVSRSNSVRGGRP